MNLIADIRSQARLTQAELAERAGTSRTRLSAYENERTTPELDTVERIARAAGVELTYAPIGSRRLRGQIDDVRATIASDRTADAVRLIAELIAWVRAGVVHLDALGVEPAPLGDRRWDALIGGVAEMLFHEAGRPTPGWASSPGRVLDRPWFVSRLHKLWPEIFRTTPAALASRGVLISAASLESV